MRIVVVLGLLLGLCGCTFRHEIANLDPYAATPPPVVANKIAGKYAVAVVGDFEKPLEIQSTKISGRMIGGDQHVTIAVGPPLKKAVVAALTAAVAEPTFVDREEDARALAHQGMGAIIVRYLGADASGQMRQTGFSMLSSMRVILNGQVSLAPPGAPEKTDRISESGANAQQIISPAWSDHAVPPSKAAAEMAIGNFAARVVAEATGALAK
jgi:hypothetical protein